jgi:NAD(P)-dependent dehydrogenase (short-subunit alcohol dehydrogenase family)
MGTYVIYGGSGGIGSAIAVELAGRGHRLHLVARDADRLAEAAARCVTAGGEASWTAADVMDDTSFDRVMTEVSGPIDGLAYCVGSITLRPAHRLGWADVEADYRRNAWGALRAAQAALTGLRAAEGTSSILLFSTVAVAQGFGQHASIAMAKGAVEALTRSLAAEWAPKIRVNAIAPSLTRTPLARALTQNEATANAIAALHAMQRLGEAGDVAPLAALLLGPESGWITGQVFGIDGGRSTLRTKG